MRFQQQLGLFGTVLTGIGCRHAKWVKRVNVASRWQDVWVAQQVATWHRWSEMTAQCTQQRGELGFVRQLCVELGAGFPVYLGHVVQVFGPLGIRHRLAHNMQTFCDQRAFGF